MLSPADAQRVASLFAILPSRLAEGRSSEPNVIAEAAFARVAVVGTAAAVRSYTGSLIIRRVQSSPRRHSKEVSSLSCINSYWATAGITTLIRGSSATSALGMGPGAAPQAPAGTASRLSVLRSSLGSKRPTHWPLPGWRVGGILRLTHRVADRYEIYSWGRRSHIPEARDRRGGGAI
jgi:hypothetical protein